MRSVTQKCINCEKIWRFLIQNEYDADEVEYASNPTLIKPRKRTGSVSYTHLDVYKRQYLESATTAMLTDTFHMLYTK